MRAKRKSKGVSLIWCWKVKEDISRFRAWCWYGVVWCGVVWCGEERKDLSSAGEKRRQKRRAIALKPNCQNLSYPYVSQKQRNGVSYHCRADREFRHTTNSKRGYHKGDQLVDQETAGKRTTRSCRPKSHRDAMKNEMETKQKEKDDKVSDRLRSEVREKS